MSGREYLLSSGWQRRTHASTDELAAGEVDLALHVAPLFGRTQAAHELLAYEPTSKCPAASARMQGNPCDPLSMPGAATKPRDELGAAALIP